MNVLVLVSPAMAVNTAVDAPMNVPAVGSRYDPELTWTSREFPCNKYVISGGSASGVGTQSDPWQSLKYAVEEARAGDSVCVAGGTYRENHFVPQASGTYENPITFLSTGEIILRPDHTKADADLPVFDFNAANGSIGYWAIDRFPMDREGRDGAGFQFYGLNNNDGIHHVIIQNTEIRNSKAASGMLLRGRVHNFLLRANSFKNIQRWMVETPNGSGGYTYSDPQHSRTTTAHLRRDANGISIEGTNRGAGLPSVERIFVERNVFSDNGGDGIQCLGVNDSAGAFSGDPSDIDIVDNKVMNTAGSSAIEENAFDIKSCQHVSIRARSLPGAPTGSKMSEFKSTNSSIDSTGNNDGGAAIIVHYAARQVLIENNRIWNACSGILVGRHDMRVNDIVIRRNAIFNVRYKDSVGTSAADLDRCKGYGIAVSNANRADIYNNTIDGAQKAGLHVGYDGSVTAAGVPNDIAIWQNIVRLSRNMAITNPYWMNIVKGTAVNSDYNIYWRHDGALATDKFFNEYGTLKDRDGWRQNRDLTLPATTMLADPLFVTDPMMNDYFTQPGSPARDNAPLYAVPGSYCGANPDVGFLESCS